MAKLYNKYEVRKTDGSAVDPDAQYFVLRLDTDIHARVALYAYAASVFRDDREFSGEILDLLDELFGIKN